jgi:uncharacterized oxidoreductase
MTETTDAGSGTPSTVLCDGADLHRFTAEILTALGTPAEEAADMAAQIVGSELAGHESHGLRRLSEYVARADKGIAVPASVGRIDLDRGSLARIHGDRGFGHVVVSRATRLAIERARTHGIAGVAVHDSEPAGRLADFCERAAEEGIATLVFVNDGGAGQVATPPGGTEARLSTNPIAFGFPRARPPHLVLDMATTAVAMGRVSEWRDRGEPIPAEWATPDGVLRFLGGPKGFGLALIAEAFAGVLASGGTVQPQPGEERQAVLIIAIDVDVLRPLGDATTEVESFLSYVRDVPLEPEASAVRIPGESSAMTSSRRSADGTPLQAFTWQRMQHLAERFGVRPPSRRH